MWIVGSNPTAATKNKTIYNIMEKLTEFSALKEMVIHRVVATKYDITFHLNNGAVCTITLDDDGPQNDSHAFFKGYDELNEIANKTVIDTKCVEVDKDNTVFGLEFDDGKRYTFESVHEHNGYYGYRYYVNFY